MRSSSPFGVVVFGPAGAASDGNNFAVIRGEGSIENPHHLVELCGDHAPVDIFRPVLAGLERQTDLSSGEVMDQGA